MTAKNSENAVPKHGNHVEVDATGTSVKSSQTTQKEYLAKTAALWKLAKNEMSDDLEWMRRLKTAKDQIELAELFLTWWLSNDERYTKSSIKTMRAGINFTIRSRLSAEEAEDRIADFKAGPTPSDGPKYGTKRKTLSEKELLAFLDACTRTDDKEDRVVAAFVLSSLTLPSRPCEWQTAVIKDNILFIRTAKATNGRGNDLRFAEGGQQTKHGQIMKQEFSKDEWRRFSSDCVAGTSFRSLDVSRQDKLAGDSIGFLVRNLAEYTKKFAGWDAAYKALAARISRRSDNAGLKKPIAPSSCRHISLAHAKALFGHHFAGAAAGHKDALTSIKSYHRANLRGVTLVSMIRPTDATLLSTMHSEDAKPPRKMGTANLSDSKSLKRT